MREDWIECTLDEVCEVLDNLRKPINSTERNERIKGKDKSDLFPYYGATGQVGYIDDFLTDGNYVLLGEDAAPFLDFTKDVAYKITGKTWVNNHAHILKSYFNDDFLLHFLNQFQYRDYVTGTTRLKLTQGALKRMPVKLAPLPIQRAIVSKIEALFSDLDNGIANFKKAQEQLKIYRQAVLKKAFEGELTKEWREKQTNLPTAEELLKQIKEERQNHYNQQIEDWKKAVKVWEKNGKVDDKPRKPSIAKEFPPLNQSEMNELPKEWMWVNWSDILDYNDGAFKRGPFGSSLTKSMFVNSGYKVYEQYCPINDDCSFERYYITDEKFKELNSFSVKSGDFLISCSGVTLGRITQVPEIFKEGVINQALLRLRINKDFIDDKFFKFYFRSPFFQKQIFDNSTGSAIPNIKGVNELKIIPVPLLTKAEQNQIIQEIEFRLSVCDKMEQSISESIEKAEALRQSILKKAFEGKLLSQAEIELCKTAADYEPASELLKKIQAEKSAKEQDKKKPRKK